MLETLVKKTAIILVSIGALTIFGCDGKGESGSTRITGEQYTSLMKPGKIGDIVEGNETAPVTIIEYASTTCRHCANFHVNVIPELRKKYIDTGKVKLIFREFVRNGIDMSVSMVARCSNNKYKPIINTVFKRHNSILSNIKNAEQEIFNIARSAGFTKDTFEKCLKNKTIADGLEEINKKAEKFMVNSTPTFFINGKMVKGYLSFKEFSEIVDKELINVKQ